MKSPDRSAKRATRKSPVRENCTPGFVRGHPGDRVSYLDYNIILYAVGLISFYFLLKNKEKPFVNNAPVTSLKTFFIVFLYGQRVSFIQTFYKSSKNYGVILLLLLSAPIIISPLNLWCGVSNLMFAAGVWHPPVIKILGITISILPVTFGFIGLYIFFYILWCDYRKSMERIEQK